jgi:hypothetical protein
LNGTADVRGSWEGPLPYATPPLDTTRTDPCTTVTASAKRALKFATLQAANAHAERLRFKEARIVAVEHGGWRRPVDAAET